MICLIQDSLSGTTQIMLKYFKKQIQEIVTITYISCGVCTKLSSFDGIGIGSRIYHNFSKFIQCPLSSQYILPWISTHGIVIMIEPRRYWKGTLNYLCKYILPLEKQRILWNSVIKKLSKYMKNLTEIYQFPDLKFRYLVQFNLTEIYRFPDLKFRYLVQFSRYQH